MSELFQQLRTQEWRWARLQFSPLSPPSVWLYYCSWNKLSSAWFMSRCAEHLIVLRVYTFLKTCFCFSSPTWTPVSVWNQRCCFIAPQVDRPNQTDVFSLKLTACLDQNTGLLNGGEYLPSCSCSAGYLSSHSSDVSSFTFESFGQFPGLPPLPWEQDVHMLKKLLICQLLDEKCLYFYTRR